MDMESTQPAVPQWVSVTHASVAGVAGRKSGGTTSVWQWLTPAETVASEKATGAVESREECWTWRDRRKEDVVKGTPPCERMAHTVSALGPDGTEVLVFGGISINQQYLSDSYLLNTSTPAHMHKRTHAPKARSELKFNLTPMVAQRSGNGPT
jgi:hypothetical protein